MTRTPLALEHQSLISEALDTIGMHLSEFSFPNLYLFRDTHKYEVVTTEHGMFISGLSYDNNRYLMPLANPENGSIECFKELKGLLASGEWDFIFPVAKLWLDCFDEEDFIWDYNENDSDYLYFTEKFKTYPGKKMHKRRNLLNQFLNNYEALLMPLTDDVLEDAIKILDDWQQSSPQELETSDYNQCLEALKMREKLGLTSAMAFADGEPAGFLLGEALNDDTFTIHFAKADINFKGVYQFLFSRFANDFCPSYEYMNLEQDMGNPGLRKTKLSYRPDLMAHKYRISLK